MYSRRIKLNKKKPKATSRQKPTWGPRLALIERERAIASGGIVEDGGGDEEEELYDIQHEFIHSAKRLHGPSPPSHPTGPPPSGATMASQQGRSLYGNRHNNEQSSASVDPVLRLGSGGSPNYFYYNYSRRTAPNAAGGAAAPQQRKTSCPEPSSSVHSQQNRERMMMNERNGKLTSHLQQQQQHRRASYVLGSSSGYCSGSVTTLSTCANNNENNSNFSKPLTLIIPPHDGHGHHHAGGEYNGNRSQYHQMSNSNGMILMKRQVSKNYPPIPRGNHHDHKHQDDFGMEDNSLEESFPSSSAYQSSGDEEEGVPSQLQQRQSKRPFQNPMAHMNNNKRKERGAGILQVLTKKEVVQVHAAPKLSPGGALDDMGTATEPETLEMGAENSDTDEKNENGTGNKLGSTITALHKGITMVYVPMAEKERKSRGEGDEFGEDIPELGHGHQNQMSDNDCCSASTTSSYRDGGGAASKEPEDSLMSSNFILKKKVDQVEDHSRCSGGGTGGAGGGGVMDSLLDSFESMLFKPKPGESFQKIQEKFQQQQDGQQTKGIRKRPEQPPPLPPGNSQDKGGGGAGPVEKNQKQKNLRFALENLETVLNPSSLKTPSPSASEDSSVDNHNHHHQRHHVPAPPPPTKKVLKKVTLSLPGEDAVSSRNHELLLNYEELNTCSTEVLSCGHVKNDDYSTLSSMTSSAQEMSDLEEVINGCSGSGHDNGGACIESTNSSSGGESDAGSSGGGGGGGVLITGKNNPAIREPRSVLQQLRDLSRLIRGSSPTKPSGGGGTQAKKDDKQQADNSFYLHAGNSNLSEDANKTDTEIAKRKTSDATDNSADSGKGSGTSASGGSSGQEVSSASSAEPSPNNIRGGPNSTVICVKGKSSSKKGTPGGILNSKVLQQANGRKLKIATIRGRGGGTGSRHFDDENGGDPRGIPCERGDDTCSQRSSLCSCQDCYDYRSDCNECQLYSKPPNSKELCSNEMTGSGNPGRKLKLKQQTHPTINLPPPPPPPSQQRAQPVSGGKSVSKLLVRRTSSRIRAAAARRTASLRRAREYAKQQRERKPVILDYCDCSNCDIKGCGDHAGEEDDDDGEFDEVDYDEEIEATEDAHGYCSDKNCQRPPSRLRQNHRRDALLVPIQQGKGSKHHSKSSGKSSDRKVSNSSQSSGISSTSSGKLSSRIAALRSSSAQAPQPQPPTHSHSKQKPSQLLRQSDAASAGAALANPVSVMVPPHGSVSNLFTIDEANEESVYGETAQGGGASGAVVIGKGQRNLNNSTTGSASSSSGSGPRVDFQFDDDQDNRVTINGCNGGGNKKRHSQHSHPKCWLAPDATLGWSDLESLYSQNMKMDGSLQGNRRGGGGGGGVKLSKKGGHPLPLALRDECPTCWKELSEMKKNCPDPNRTVDRTKRMFIWLNRRHKEFHAPWWEAKKQASMRWLMTKSFAHAVPKDKIPDPFKESKKGKPTKYSLRDEIVKGLVSGRLYCMALDSLYRSQQNNYHLNQNLTHWEIIKILSRRGIYIAQPSDMKLTETTLRQKKPIRTAAHIALIEAMMGLYAKEILGRDRIAQTLRSFGRSIDPDTNSPERLVISWINTAVTTLKSYILSNAAQQLPNNKVNRWLNLPDVGEIRDLCDGVGICALFALYCSNDLKIEEISVPEPGDTLTIYDSITNHSTVQKLCDDLFPEPIYHLCVTDFLYIHGCMKQNILCFLVDLFVHLEINPILRVNRLTHVPIRVEL